MLHRETRIICGALLLWLSIGCRSEQYQDYESLSSRIAQGVSDPLISSETFLIRSYGDHRIRLERVCGLDHCATLAFLEYLPGEFPRAVQSSIEIEEVARGVAAFIEEVKVVEKEPYSFDLYLAEPRNAIWRVTPRDGTRYLFEIVKPDQFE